MKKSINQEINLLPCFKNQTIKKFKLFLRQKKVKTKI